MRKGRARLGIVTFALVAAAFAAIATTASTANRPIIKIGVLAGLTGSSNTVGVPYVNGARMAAADINRLNGIKGRKVSLSIADNETQATASVQAALKLVDADKVHTLVCSCFTVLFFPIAEAIANKNIVVTSNGSTTPVIRTLPGHVVSTIATDDVLGAELARFAYGLKFKRAALLTVNDPYGSSFRKTVSDTYRKLGGQILIDLVADGGLPDYRPEMKRIIDSGAKVVLMGTYTNDARLQFRQLVQQGWDGIAFKLYPSATRLDQDKEANRRFFGLDNIMTSDAKGAAWQARYKATYGQDPTIWSAVGYDAVRLNALAVGNARNMQPASIKAAMRAQAAKYVGPTGRIEFDKTMVRIKPSLAFYTLLGGKYVRVDGKGKVIK
jgi:branched-chain amino acid transport system substrate-binding protein